MATSSLPSAAAAEMDAPAQQPVSKKQGSDYRGFVAGIFSGIAKLTGEWSPLLN